MTEPTTGTKSPGSRASPSTTAPDHPSSGTGSRIKIPWVGLLVLLTVQILAPALNDDLWYDELDGRMLGEIGFDPIAEDMPPIDRIHVDAEGRARVFSPGWIALNRLGLVLDHGIWRGLHVVAWVLALALWTGRRLRGADRLIPVLLALAAPLVLSAAGTTRAYNAGALGIVLALVASRSRNRTLWLCLTLWALWLIHLVPFVMAVFLLIPSFVSRFRNPATRWSDRWIVANLVLIALAQMAWMTPGGMPRATLTTPLFDRLAIVWRAFNVEVAGLLLVIPGLIRWRQDRMRAWVLLASLVLLPVVIPFFRVAYLAILLPLVLVELTACYAHWPLRGKFALALLVATTQLVAWPLDRLLPDGDAGQFTDPVARIRSPWRTTPLVALHEARHRRWSSEDGEVATVLALRQPGDHVLYEYSRLTVLARLWNEGGMGVTGIFRDDPRSFPDNPVHPHAEKLGNQSPLVTPTPPFWAFTPVDAVLTETREDLSVAEMKKWLSQWGEVIVFPVPERDGNWIPNVDWPPEESDAFSDRVVYYVR